MSATPPDDGKKPRPVSSALASRMAAFNGEPKVMGAPMPPRNVSPAKDRVASPGGGKRVSSALSDRMAGLNLGQVATAGAPAPSPPKQEGGKRMSSALTQRMAGLNLGQVGVAGAPAPVKPIYTTTRVVETSEVTSITVTKGEEDTIAAVADRASIHKGKRAPKSRSTMKFTSENEEVIAPVDRVSLAMLKESADEQDENEDTTNLTSKISDTDKKKVAEVSEGKVRRASLSEGPEEEGKDDMQRQEAEMRARRASMDRKAAEADELAKQKKAEDLARQEAEMLARKAAAEAKASEAEAAAKQKQREEKAYEEAEMQATKAAMTRRASEAERVKAEDDKEDKLRQEAEIAAMASAKARSSSEAAREKADEEAVNKLREEAGNAARRASIDRGMAQTKSEAEEDQTMSTSKPVTEMKIVAEADLRSGSEEGFAKTYTSSPGRSETVGAGCWCCTS